MNKFNNKKNYLMLTIGVLMIGLFIVTGSYAYWMWTSDNNKLVLFNTSKELSEYIIYDEGESKFVGDFQVGESYLDGVHTTISIYKTEEASNVDLFATINMDINEIGEGISSSKAVKWTLTKGNSTNPGEVLASGNFLGAVSGESFPLYSNVEVTTTLEEYTVWLWIDSSENPSDELTGETLDTLIWTQVDQITNNNFEITRLNARGGIINATVVNTLYNVTEYAITTSSEEPTEWINIPENEQSNNYLLEYSATELGTYYVWFKDSEDKIVSNQIEVTSLETTPPTGSLLITGESSSLTATLTANDTESGIKELYGWKVTTSNTCDETVTDFTETTEPTYSFSIDSDNMYYLCSRFEDNAGNYGYTSMLIPQSNIDYAYTGGYQTFNVPESGYYKIETYGAQGGGENNVPGLGGYSSGIIELNRNDTLYVYVGQSGGYNSSAIYNGGGYTNRATYGPVTGGGATDIRYFGSTTPTESVLTWNSTLGLNSRIMVASGGGGAEWNGSIGGAGGTLIGENGYGANDDDSSISDKTKVAYGGSQTTGGTAYQIDSYSWTGGFGYGGYTTDAIDGGGMGGGGYYGGGSMYTAHGGGGGSSFISGYSGVNAITSSSDRTHTNNTLHYSNKYFIDGEMQGGVNSGDGKTTITYLGSNSPERINPKLDNVRYIKDCASGNSVNSGNHWIELQAIYNGENVAYGKTINVTSTPTSYGTGIAETIVDGIMEEAYDYTDLGNGLQCVTIDLGTTYNLDEIAVWHFYDGGRTYSENITYTSSDGSTWKHTITKYEAETVNGKRVSAYEEDMTDEDAPTGTLSATFTEGIVTAKFTNVSDNGGTGIGKYQYLIQTDSTCPSSGYSETTNSTYTFTMSTGGTYYVCGRLKDNVGNVSEPYVQKVELFTVNYDANMFSVDNQVISNVTVTYDPETSYLTLNGTATANIQLMYITSQTFTEGEQYKLSYSVISGSYTKTGNSTLTMDIKTSANANVSTRNYKDASFPTDSGSDGTLTVSSVGASEGSMFVVWIWVAEELVFTNYKIKIDIQKIESKTVENGDTYGTLPTPVKHGHKFLGWYTQATGGTQITSSSIVNLTADQTLYAHWARTVVTLNANMLSIANKTENGVTVTYDPDSSYLTLNGTATTSIALMTISNQAFTAYDQYKMSYSVISGSYTKSGSSSLTMDVRLSGGTSNVSTRNYKDTTFPTDSGATGTLTVSSVGASEGSVLYVWIWISGETVFTNYKIKINLTKVQTKNVYEGSTYGTLPTPTRTGYAFEGWYTGENGSGTKITSSTTVTNSADHTLYAHWTSSLPVYTYTGSHELIDDGSGNWRIKFKSSGTLTVTNWGTGASGIDVFLVGGGGGGRTSNNAGFGGGGGGGGYTKTVKGVSVSATSYTITVGAGGGANTAGGTTTAFGSSASGGTVGGTSWQNSGGNGGSGGGGGGNWDGTRVPGAGGSNGGNGGVGNYAAGTGQGTNTYEFGESGGTLYSGGGAGGTSGSVWGLGTSAGNSGGSGGGGNSGANATYYGGGGGGGNFTGGSNGSGTYGAGGSGYSGIVVIRNKR